MSQSAVAERETVREAEPRSTSHQQTDAKAKTRVVENQKPALDRPRNVGGRLMA